MRARLVRPGCRAAGKGGGNSSQRTAQAHLLNDCQLEVVAIALTPAEPEVLDRQALATAATQARHPQLDETLGRTQAPTVVPVLEEVGPVHAPTPWTGQEQLPALLTPDGCDLLFHGPLQRLLHQPASAAS